jgi:hypothetical protein
MPRPAQRRPLRPDRGYVCTFSALILKGREGHLLHVGDSRIYRLHPQALEALTEDHRVRLSSAESHLARALGADATVEIDYRRWPLAEGEVYLLATDGAYEYLTPPMHAALARHPADLDAAAAPCGHRPGALQPGHHRAAGAHRRPAAGRGPAAADASGLCLAAAAAGAHAFEGFTPCASCTQRPQPGLAGHRRRQRQPVALKVPARTCEPTPRPSTASCWRNGWPGASTTPTCSSRPREARPRQHLFVAMEYIDGQTLAQWMRDHPGPAWPRCGPGCSRSPAACRPAPQGDAAPGPAARERDDRPHRHAS